MPSARIRASVSGSRTGLPPASRYSKPLPRPRRLMPGVEQSTRRSLGMRGVFPCAGRLGLRPVMARMDVETRIEDGIVVITPRGELDVAGTPLVEDAVVAATDEPGVDGVVIDLSGL